jgi:hypothetical protein
LAAQVSHDDRGGTSVSYIEALDVRRPDKVPSVLQRQPPLRTCPVYVKSRATPALCVRTFTCWTRDLRQVAV